MSQNYHMNQIVAMKDGIPYLVFSSLNELKHYMYLQKAEGDFPEYRIDGEIIRCFFVTAYQKSTPRFYIIKKSTLNDDSPTCLVRDYNGELGTGKAGDIAARQQMTADQIRKITEDEIEKWNMKEDFVAILCEKIDHKRNLVSNEKMDAKHHIN